MAVLPRVALIALIVCVPDVPLAGAEQASCTPGESVTTALPPLAYQPNTFKPYYIGVAGGDLPYEIASSNGSHCSVEGEVTRAVELHPFVNPGEADAVPAIPIATARFDVMLDVRLPVTPPARRCNYADVNGDPLANADCFHASQDPTSDPEQAAKWTARVRVVKANG